MEDMTSAPEKTLLRRFGQNVAQARKKQGITQQQLCDKVGMSVVAIAYIETGKRWVRLSTLDKIANALNVPISDLLDI